MLVARVEGRAGGDGGLRTGGECPVNVLLCLVIIGLASLAERQNSVCLVSAVRCARFEHPYFLEFAIDLC